MTVRREDIDDCDVRYMYEVEGKNYQEIADRFGVSKSTIYFRLHPEKQKENSDKYNQSENGKASAKRYRQTEKGKEVRKRYQQSEIFKESKKRYYYANREECKEAAKIYKQTEKGKDAVQKYYQTEKGKECMRKHRAKRRYLGFIPLNIPFSDSEAHHIDMDHVIYIAEEIHHSIYHNVRTGEGMDIINKEAFEFLEWELNEEAWSKVA